MTKEQLNAWVSKLGKAWTSLDVDAALSLVDKNEVVWHESPLEGPLTSWDEVYKQWQKDLKDQKDVQFSHEVLVCKSDLGVARWKATLTKLSSGETIDMDGIFSVKLNDRGLCTQFMMWTVSQTRN